MQRWFAKSLNDCSTQLGRLPSGGYPMKAPEQHYIAARVERTTNFAAFPNRRHQKMPRFEQRPIGRL